MEGVRTIGGCGLELFVGHLEGSRFREKTQVIPNLMGTMFFKIIILL